MSKILKEVPDRHLGHIVKCNGKFYYVDSVYNFYQGYETMVFRCNKSGDVKSWKDLYSKHYPDAATMMESHNYIIRHLEDFINNS